MSERRLDTINVSGGEYAKVATRLKAFIEEHADRNVSIETSYEWKDGWVIFQSVVTCPRGKFTGHSLGQIGKKDKAFEKQETIAVGRALAFAGYLASGEIASLEEMTEYDREHESEISAGQYNQLKRDWVSAFGSVFSEDEYAEQFRLWAMQEAGLEEFAVGNYRDWTAENLASCQSSLDASAEAALLETGLIPDAPG